MGASYLGRLKKWNVERGFGFIVADDGGVELFVHITAFSRIGPVPTQGEILSFEVEPAADGKKRAVRVRRPGETESGAPVRPVRLHRSHANQPGSFMGKFFSVVLILAVGGVGYSQYSKRAASFDAHLPSPPALLSPAKLTVPMDFKCDGRNSCSQMTSCREATLFLQNCPGMKMDGNGDGVPCEQQWCN